jgi:hypothetical protein
MLSTVDGRAKADVVVAARRRRADDGLTKERVVSLLDDQQAMTFADTLAERGVPVSLGIEPPRPTATAVPLTVAGA